MQQRQYKSKIFQSMYNQFWQMFNQEGDCYDSILQSLESEYEHNMLPTDGPPKHVVRGVLRDVTVDFYKDKIEVLTEEQYLNASKQV